LEHLTETQVRNYFESLNTELGFPNANSECAFLCPVHGEKHSSASFNLNKHAWHCFPCDDGGDLYKMEMLLFPEDSFPVVKERVDAICDGDARPEGLYTLPAKKELKNRTYRPSTEVETYLYQAVIDGELKDKYAITKAFYDDNPTEKTFRVWYKTSKDGKRLYGLPDNFPRILYKLPEVQQAQAVFIVEGEKCVDRLMKVLPPGLAAICNPFGAGKWEDSFSIILKGKR
jgi:putative DNA primase/helicase